MYSPDIQYSMMSSVAPSEHLNVTTRVPMPYRIYKSLEDCLTSLGPTAYGPNDGGIYCNATWDKILCWPASPANETIRQHCPDLRGLDPTKYGYRKCSSDGRWEGSKPGDYSNPIGWTNYTNCYTPDSYSIYNKLFKHKNNTLIMKQIANGVQIMEIFGLSLSLLSLALSIFVFFYFRGLRCHRTRMHRNLFVAIFIHVLISLVVKVDEIVARASGEQVGGAILAEPGTIYGTPVVCEILMTLVEYTKTVMFLWMFIEGLYLHNMLVISVFSGKPNYLFYYLLGWGFPSLLTIAWAVTSGLIDTERCWFGYTYRKYYWIVNGPRAAVIAINLIFLINIIRVLVTKLRDSNSTETVQVTKAVKAAIVLLPLLGVNNFLAMVEGPVDNVVKFGLWSYTSTFLISFQGFFIALLYCFLNGEVNAHITAINNQNRDLLGKSDRHKIYSHQNDGLFDEPSEHTIPLRHSYDGDDGHTKTGNYLSHADLDQAEPTNKLRHHQMNGHKSLLHPKKGETGI